MSDPVVDLRDATRIYRVGEVEVRALAGVSLLVEAGEFIAVVGASGSGKSTLMAILGCLERPSSGQYLFAGIDTAALAEPELARLRSERLGFVFQSFNLLPRTSAVENAALPLFYSVAAPRGHMARIARARRSLAALGLSDRAENTPGQLSGGQQQRVAIARALINAPDLLLADEPTGNLDSRTSREIMETLRRLNREEGLTIVLVTHEADIAAYADRVVTMRDGHIVGDERRRAPPAETAAVPRPPAHLPASAAAGAAAASWAFGRMILGAAVQAIGRNMMRSALTTLGVFVGVAALIAMVAVGQGANEAVLQRIESLGTNLVVILPGAVTSFGMRSGFGSASTLTVEDARAIAREDPAVAQVGYVIRQSGQTGFGSQNWTTSIIGVTPNYPPMTNWRIAAGRPINAADQADAALVALLGQTVYRQLFAPSDNPVGATILVKGVALRVVGVLGAKGQTPYGQDQDDVVMIPFSTAENRVLGVAAPNQPTPLSAIFLPQPNPYGLHPRLTGFVHQIYIQATRQSAVPSAIAEAVATLQRRHRITPGTADDFSVRNLSQIAETAESSGRVLAMLLAAVASISLLVGGIGIMNILLVSVTERTREIGLRMAIGARRLHVLLQFLAEAVFLSAAGGIAGIGFGVAASEAISLFAGWRAPLSALAMLGGFAFAAAVGVFFGYYPARKAAHLDPIEALRYE